MASPLLWQNSERTVVLIDVPRSISAAQGTAEYPCFDTLRSSEPVSSPFPSNEPKSAAAKVKLQSNTVEGSFHAEYRDILQQAVEQVRQNHQGPWCHPRPFIAATANRSSKKRKLQEHGDNDVVQPLPPPPELPAEIAFRANDFSKGEDFHLTPNFGEGVDGTYRIPPKSSFSLSDCSSSQSFLSSIRNQAQDDSTRRNFDVVILDPPWPNRSVKRSHKTPGSTYATSTSLDDVFQLVVGTDLDMVMADGCLVGFWITNKQAVRELICGDGGIFDTWGIELEEEWIWLKTTAGGEPVSAVDSIWRKPYEILLLGRKRSSTTLASTESVVRRRTIISVPDLHSRKPCLKSLIESMMPDPQDYRALEVFARHLVSGWWSWGNECIKFNWSGYWRSSVDAENETR